jgi:hypothetical protein
MAKLGESGRGGIEPMPLVVTVTPHSRAWYALTVPLVAVLVHQRATYRSGTICSSLVLCCRKDERARDKALGHRARSSKLSPEEANASLVLQVLADQVGPFLNEPPEARFHVAVPHTAIALHRDQVPAHLPLEVGCALLSIAQSRISVVWCAAVGRCGSVG